MISLKSSREIELMDRAGTVVALVHKRLKEIIKPGITTKYIDQICEEVIRENDCTPSFKGLYGFPGSVCTSVNEVLVHGIPSSQILKNGDIEFRNSFGNVLCFQRSNEEGIIIVIINCSDQEEKYILNNINGNAKNLIDDKETYESIKGTLNVILKGNQCKILKVQ